MEAYYNAEYYGAMIGPSVNFINNLSISLVMILEEFYIYYHRKKLLLKDNFGLSQLEGLLNL